MIDISNFNDCIIVCPNAIKEYLLRIKEKEQNIKFLTKKEIFDNTYFSYEFKDIYKLAKEKIMRFDNTKEIIDNLINIPERFNDCYELLKKHLNYNELFKNLFVNKKVYIIGYSTIDEELINALNKNTNNYQFVNIDSSKYQHSYNEFITREDEVLFLINKICTLIKNGIDINKIYLYKYPKEYNLIFKKYAYYYNLPIEFENDTTLYETNLFKAFLDDINKYDLNIAISNLENVKNDKYNTLTKLAICINDASFIKDKEDLIKALAYLAKNTKLDNVTYEKSIKLIDYNKIVNDDEYVFIPSFALNIFPHINKDIDLLTDNEKIECERNTSTINNKIEKELLKRFINNTKNLIITFSNNNYSSYKSTLISQLNIVKNENNNIAFYNQKMAEVKVAKLKDEPYSDDEESKYANTFTNEEIRYKKYDNQFKPFNILNKKEFCLSYTAMNMYYECPFKYYVKYILKLKDDTNFNLNLGNLFHQILDDSNKKEIDLNDYSDKLNNNDLTTSEKYFTKKLINQVFDVINLNNEFLETTQYKEIKTEEKIELGNFEGKIDKYLIDEENKNIIVIDYKTGNYNFSDKYLTYGCDLQLPSYIYLLENHYKGYKVTGSYIQKVCEDLDKDKKHYLLNGITIDDVNIQNRINNNISKYIKLTKRTEDVFAEYYNIVKEKIDNAVNSIQSNEFQIEPLKIEKTCDACTYCNYKSICYVKRNNFKNVEKEG